LSCCPSCPQFGFSAFDGDVDVFREDDDEDFDSDQHSAGSDD
jgi:hypothetical protein